MTSCKPGDIALVPFPFSDLRVKKKRPALVLSWVTSQILPTIAVMAMITSQVESEKITGDCLLKDWHESGLLHPSMVRLAKLVTIEEKLIFKKLGALSKGDQNEVGKNLKKVFSAWQ